MLLAALALAGSAAAAAAGLQTGPAAVGAHWSRNKYPDSVPEGAAYYLARKNDTLWGVAKRFLGNPYLWTRIWEQNSYIVDPHWIYPGDPLILPIVAPVDRASEAVTGAPPTPPPEVAPSPPPSVAPPETDAGVAPAPRSSPPPLGPAVAAGERFVSRDEMLEAMRQSQGYNLEATTNGARFQAEVILRLVRQARERDPERRPLFLGHAEWFSAYLERTGLTTERAPAFIRLAHEHGQDMEVDYRSERVLDTAPEPRPEVAANVIIWWPRRPDGPKKYSYEDLLATPKLKVTNERVIAYRLLDLGGMVLYDKVEGLKGRPLTGLLALLFKIIGEGHVVENRMIISADGLQISRARARKGFLGVTTTVTVYPDGRTEKDLPKGRTDLAALEARLKQALSVRYRPLDEALRAR